MLRLLLALYGFAIPYETLWTGIGRSESMFKPYRIVGLVILTLWALALLRRARKPRFDSYDRIFLTIFGLGLGLTALWYVLDNKGNLQLAANVTLLGLFAWSVALVLKNEARTAGDLEFFWRAFVLGNVTALASSFLLTDPYASGRLVGFYENPNSLALSLSASSAYLVSSSLNRGRSWRSLLELAALLWLSTGLLLTGSRSGLLAFVASMLLSIFVVRGRAGRTHVRAFSAIMLAALIGFTVYETWESTREDNAALQRLEWERAKTGSGRLDLWRSGWNVAQDYYFLGVGASQYRYYHDAYIDRLSTLYTPQVSRSNIGVHSEYLNLLVSTGLVGLVLYLMLLARAAKNCWRSAVNGAERVAAGQTALPVLAILAVVELTAILFGSPLFFFLLALVALGSRLGPPRRTAKHRPPPRPSRAVASRSLQLRFGAG